LVYKEDVSGLGKRPIWARGYKTFKTGQGQKVHQEIIPIDDLGRTFESEEQFFDWMTEKAIYYKQHFLDSWEAPFKKHIAKNTEGDVRSVENYMKATGFKGKLEAKIALTREKALAHGRMTLEELPPYDSLDVVKDYLKWRGVSISTLHMEFMTQRNFYEFCRYSPFDWNYADFLDWFKQDYQDVALATKYHYGSHCRQIVDFIISKFGEYQLKGLINLEQLKNLQEFTKQSKTDFPKIKVKIKGATKSAAYSFDEVQKILATIPQLDAPKPDTLELEFLIGFEMNAGARVGSNRTRLIQQDGWKEHPNPNGTLNMRWEYVDWTGEKSGVNRASITMYDKGSSPINIEMIEGGKPKEFKWNSQAWNCPLTPNTLKALKSLAEIYGTFDPATGQKKPPSEGWIFQRLDYGRALAYMKVLLRKTGLYTPERMADLKEFHGLRKAFVRYLVKEHHWNLQLIMSYGDTWTDSKTLMEHYFPRDVMMEQLKKALDALPENI
jgi:hypothetical protein